MATYHIYTLRDGQRTHAAPHRTYEHFENAKAFVDAEPNGRQLEIVKCESVYTNVTLDEAMGEAPMATDPVITEEKLQELDAHITHLTDLHRQQEATLWKLRRALTIKHLVPDAFEHGAVRTRVEGNIEYVLRECDWVLERGDGSTVRIPLLDVPGIVWPLSAIEWAKSSHRNREILKKKGVI